MSHQLDRCVFCRIVNGDERPGGGRGGYIMTEHSVIFDPIGPVAPGHTLVVPRVHVTDFTQDPQVTAAVAADAADWARAIGRDPRVNADGFNLITSAGSAATQTVFHLHFHIIPRCDGDGLELPWTGAAAKAQAWSEGFMTEYRMTRGYSVAESVALAEKVPDHLVEDIPWWNPYEPDAPKPDWVAFMEE